MFPFPRVMSAFWNPFFSKVSGSAPFSKGHVSFLEPFFFQRFLEVLPFPRVMSTWCTFFQRFLDVLPFPRAMSIFPEVDQCVFLVGFPKFPFARFASPSPMLPFPKGDSIVHQQTPWHFAETLLW